MDLSAKEKQLINILCQEFPLTSKPYKDLGKQIGWSEEEVINKLNEWKKSGLLRRLSAVVKHYEVGYTENAMIVWNVPEDKLEQVGNKLAQFDIITHCYARPRQPEWKYNLYSMIHCSSQEECRQLAKSLGKEVGIKDYKVLFTKQELKKVPYIYFSEEEAN